MRNKPSLLLIVIILSVTSVSIAFFFQYQLEILPCKLCLWQRWPHFIGIPLGIIGLLTLKNNIPLTLTALINSGFGIILSIYHSGIEREFWQGFSNCTGLSDISDISPKQLLSALFETPVTKCDSIPWSLMGLSMANLNIAVLLVIFFFWIKILIVELEDYRSNSKSS